MDDVLLDPRLPQKRYATTPSGRGVWMEVSGDDRLKAISHLPGRWPEIIRRRELGEDIQDIRNSMRIRLDVCYPSCTFIHTKDELTGEEDEEHVGPVCLGYLISCCYARVETELHDVAARRARLLP